MKEVNESNVVEFLTELKEAASKVQISHEITMRDLLWSKQQVLIAIHRKDLPNYFLTRLEVAKAKGTTFLGVWNGFHNYLWRKL